MVDSLPMFPENSRDDEMADTRRPLIFIGIAVLLVAVMIAALITWMNFRNSVEEFHDDCERIGGQAHDLGEETVCLLDDHVIGRTG